MNPCENNLDDLLTAVLLETQHFKFYDIYGREVVNNYEKDSTDPAEIQFPVESSFMDFIDERGDSLPLVTIWNDFKKEQVVEEKETSLTPLPYLRTKSWSHIVDMEGTIVCDKMITHFKKVLKSLNTGGGHKVVMFKHVEEVKQQIIKKLANIEVFRGFLEEQLQGTDKRRYKRYEQKYGGLL